MEKNPSRLASNRGSSCVIHRNWAEPNHLGKTPPIVGFLRASFGVFSLFFMKLINSILFCRESDGIPHLTVSLKSRANDFPHLILTIPTILTIPYDLICITVFPFSFCSRFLPASRISSSPFVDGKSLPSQLA